MIGSVLPGGNNSASSVIMAFWVGSGNSLPSIDYSQMRVGVVQKFIKHTVIFQSKNNSGKAEHIFAYVKCTHKAIILAFLPLFVLTCLSYPKHAVFYLCKESYSLLVLFPSSFICDITQLHGFQFYCVVFLLN